MRRLALGVVVLALAATPARADDTEEELAVAYDRLVARPDRHYLRAALEESVSIGIGAAWYWIDRSRQVGDWDFPSLMDRLTFKAWRFDNNPFPINFAWHAIDGGQYHVFARANGLSLPVSAGYALATSFAWEWGLEFREKFSVNDLMVTTGAGTAVGEFFHWLGRYFESAPSPRRWHGAARWVLTSTRALHNTIDAESGLRAATSPDALGLSSDIWHRFAISTGVADARVDADHLTVGELSAAGELAALPGYLTAPRLRRSFRDGNLSTARTRISLGEDTIGVDFAADAALLGYHTQDLPVGGVGTATTVSLGLAYDYRRELIGDWKGRIAQMHLLRLGVDQHVRSGKVAVRVRGRLHADFVGLDAAAYPEWLARHDGELVVSKTILRKHGYYYGWGPSASLDAEVAMPRLTIGGAVAFGRYDSQEGLDRSQEIVTDDVDAGDRVLTAEAWARVAPLGGRLYVEARLADEVRTGHVGEVESSQELRRFAISLGAAL